jgi:hypothetical protein
MITRLCFRQELKGLSTDLPCYPHCHFQILLLNFFCSDRSGLIRTFCAQFVVQGLKEILVDLVAVIEVVCLHVRGISYDVRV